MADFSSIATPRGVVAQAITDDHPTWVVRAHPTAPEHLGAGKVYAAVYRTNIGRRNGTTALEHTITIDLYAAETLSAGAENILDDRLDDLLTTLAAIDGAVWQTTERTTLEDAYHGWRTTLNFYSPDVYASAARKV